MGFNLILRNIINLTLDLFFHDINIDITIKAE